MNTYKTAKTAAMIGIYPNTVRLYEKLELIPKPERLPLQNSLRKKIVQMVKKSAIGDFDTALALTVEYLIQVRQEHANAEEAIQIVKQVLSSKIEKNAYFFKRKEVSEYLNISMDTLRNWEMNGLLTIKRKQNGYRVYTDKDICRLKIIRSLRCANYSLEAILHMLRQLSKNSNIDIKKVLDTPKEDADIIAVCDKLITSLSAAKDNANQIIYMLQKMKMRFL